MGKRGEGIDTSSFYSSGYAGDRSNVKAWDRKERGLRDDARFLIFDTWREKNAQAA